MIKPLLRKFLLKQLYVTIGVYILGFVVFMYVFPSRYHSFLAFLPVIFYIVMAVFHGTLVSASNRPVKKFSSRFLAVLGAKIFLFLIFIITYSYFNPQVAVPFLITFFILYVIYTVFEIVTLLRQLRAKSQNQ